jgi:hypothetical protein
MPFFRKASLRNFLLYVFSLSLLCVCLTLLIHPTALYGVVPVPTEGLNPVGLISKLNGRADRKVLYDSLWIPQSEGSRVYEGDLIFTFQDAAVELTFSDDLKVELKPNSLVRIQLQNGKPVVDVKMGRAEVLAKNKLIADSDQDQDQDQVDPIEDPAKDTLQELKKSEKSSFQPYPEEGTLFLLSKGGLLKLSPQVACASSCSLTLKLNGTLVAEAKSTQGEHIQLQVRLTPQQTGLFEWTFLDGPTQHHFSFEAQALSPENLRKAMQEKRKLEIF